MSSADKPYRPAGGPQPARSTPAGKPTATGKPPSAGVAGSSRGTSGQSVPEDRTAPMPRVRTGQGTTGSGSTASRGAPAAATVTSRTPRPAAPAGTSGARLARLTVRRVDPWSVMKLSFLVSVALGIVVVVASIVLWQTLQGMGIFDAVAEPIVQATRGEDGGGVNILDYIGLERVVTLTAVLAGINVVLITAFATLGAFLYNVCSSMVGGLQVTLAEEA